MAMPVMPKNSPAPTAVKKWLATLHWLSIFLLATGFVLSLATVALKSDSNWPIVLLLVVAAGGTLIHLARRLPLQNVLLAAAIIALLGSLAHAVTAIVGIPFGRLIFGAPAGIRLFGTLPWIMPLLWVVLVLNSRGVARMVLRPWRKTRTYGFWLMGLTAVFTMLLDGALEPFATRVKHYWLWPPEGFSLMPQGTPVSNSIGWLGMTLLMLAFATPSLINKQLSKRSGPDYQPLAVWLGAILLFAVGAATHGLWLAVAVDGIIALFVAAFAVRGARW
jgi:uncharacterized membrane protein